MNNPQRNCGACSSAQVQALFIELLDNSTSQQRAKAIRAHLHECQECFDRLEREEAVRALLTSSCAEAKAPEGLRQRISISFTQINFH